MIPIVKQGNLPFSQAFNKRKPVLLKEASVYFDGNNKLLWLSFQNMFEESILKMEIELSQLNKNEQIINKSRINIHKFACKYHQQQTIDNPIVILDKCESIIVKITDISFQGIGLRDDRFYQPLNTFPNMYETKKNHTLQSGQLRFKNHLGWLRFWLFFWFGVAILIIIATFQYGLI